MWPATEILEFAVCVRGHTRYWMSGCSCVRCKIVHDLNFEHLIRLDERCTQVAKRMLLQFEGVVRCDALRHLRLNCSKVFWGERAFEKEVVVEAISDRGADPKFDPREEAHHRLGHHVCGRVTHATEVVGSTSI